MRVATSPGLGSLDADMGRTAVRDSELPSVGGDELLGW